jgi:hypothetical protein
VGGVSWRAPSRRLARMRQLHPPSACASLTRAPFSQGLTVATRSGSCRRWAWRAAARWGCCGARLLRAPRGAAHARHRQALTPPTSKGPKCGREGVAPRVKRGQAAKSALPSDPSPSSRPPSCAAAAPVRVSRGAARAAQLAAAARRGPRGARRRRRARAGVLTRHQAVEPPSGGDTPQPSGAAARPYGRGAWRLRPSQRAAPRVWWAWLFGRARGRALGVVRAAC